MLVPRSACERRRCSGWIQISMETGRFSGPPLRGSHLYHSYHNWLEFEPFAHELVSVFSKSHLTHPNSAVYFKIAVSPERITQIGHLHSWSANSVLEHASLAQRRNIQVKTKAWVFFMNS